MKSFYFSTVLLLFTISLVAQNNYILTPQKKYEEYKTSIRNNEWISFKIKYDNNSERTIICKNSNGKSQMLVSLSSDILMKVTQDTLIIINTQYQNYECYTKDERLKRYPNYASISPLGIYSDFSIIDDKPNYISKKDTNNNQYVIFTTIKKSISCDRIVYKNNKPVYINPVNKKNVYNNYFNTQNGLLEFSKIKDGERHHIITVEKYSIKTITIRIHFLMTIMLTYSNRNKDMTALNFHTTFLFIPYSHFREILPIWKKYLKDGLYLTSV